jgi:ATP-dependent RNA helicase RhlE
MEGRGIPQAPDQLSGKSFLDLGLSENVVDRLRSLNFISPTRIQTEVIPSALAGLDIVGLAETGSGKTAAFGLPLVEKHGGKGALKGLILCPTREIALQTEVFLGGFRESSRLKTVCLIGGVKIGPQIDRLKKRPEIVVATPGRLLDHLERRTVSLKQLENLVMDEADHMLDLGFLPQIQAVLKAVPKDRQTMMFSATLPPAIERLAQRFMKSPEIVDLRPDGAAAAGITHELYMVDDKNKKPCLLALAMQERGSLLVFIRRKMDADWASRQLELEGHPVERIHSGRSQSQRVAALRGFREGEHKVLVATDIAARGLDIPRIGHIVNFDIPQTVEDYIHRAGRTARGSAQGVVSTIATWQDKAMLRDIEAVLGYELPRCTAQGVEPYKELNLGGSGRRRRRLL